MKKISLNPVNLFIHLASYFRFKTLLMKTKTLIFFLAMNLISFSLFAQTKESKIDKAIKDPKREENAAKADVYIQNKKIISDSTQLQNGMKPEAVTKKKKKKSCRKN